MGAFGDWAFGLLHFDDCTVLREKKTVKHEKELEAEVEKHKATELKFTLLEQSIVKTVSAIPTFFSLCLQQKTYDLLR